MKFVALPTWFLTWVVAAPFIDRWGPEDHPFKLSPRTTLEHWHASRTELCCMFDVVFWISGINWIVVAYILLTK